MTGKYINDEVCLGLLVTWPADPSDEWGFLHKLSGAIKSMLLSS